MFEAAFNGDDDASRPAYSMILMTISITTSRNAFSLADETIDYLFFMSVCLFGARLFVCLRIHDLFAQVLFRSHTKSCM